MAGPNNNAGAGGSTPPPGGPILIPISIDNVGPITAYTVVNVSMSMPVADAKNPITVTYSADNNPVIVSNMPTPAWDADGKAAFQVNIDAELINALSSRDTTLVVSVSSGQAQGSGSIAIDFP